MKALVLAAGYGSRLGELTKDRPKCLMEAGGKTLLQHVLEKLRRAGVDEVIVNLFYLPEVIEEYLARHNGFGLKIHFSHEEELLGTGGALKHAQKLLEGNEPFIVHNSDVYSDIDLRELVERHRSAKSIATLAVLKRETTRHLLFDQEGHLAGWENTDENTLQVVGGEADLEPLGFSGIQVVSPAIFPYMELFRYPFSIIAVYMHAVERGEHVLGASFNGNYWIDIGRPRQLKELQQLLGGAEELH